MYMLTVAVFSSDMRLKLTHYTNCVQLMLLLTPIDKNACTEKHKCVTHLSEMTYCTSYNHNHVIEVFQC